MGYTKDTTPKDQEILKLNEVNFDNIKFSKIRSNTTAKFINAFYNKKNLLIKLPKLNIVFDTKMNYGKLELSLSVDDPETTELFKQFDSILQEYGEEHGWTNNEENWIYLPVLKGLDTKYSPFIKFKIPLNNEQQYDTKFYGSDRKEIEMTSQNSVCNALKRGVSLLSAVEFSGVWFMTTKDNKKQWGPAFKLVQLRLCDSQDKITSNPDYLFEEDSDSVLSESAECLIDSD
jgi:hypothetical protein